MSNRLILPFSVACYGVFLLVFLYLLGFLGDLPSTALGQRLPELAAWFPYTVDTGRSAPGMLTALVVDLALIVAFGLQHSVMARQGFKRVWTRVVAPQAERSAYVLASSVVLMLILWFWQPIPTPVLWSLESQPAIALAWGVLGLGVLILLWSTFLIDHFDLFGLRQAWEAQRGAPSHPPRFMTPALYQLVRHPLYVGWFLIFWGTPHLSLGHALFAAGMSVYIVVAIRYEERDLVALHGDAYERYREQVPMLVPRPGRRVRGQLAGERRA